MIVALVILVQIVASILAVAASPQAPAPQQEPAFEVASVKPNTSSDLSIPSVPAPPDGITLVNHPLESIIRYAYRVQYFSVVGMPRWAHEERFNIAAKASRPISDAERRLMLRFLLVERFGLKARLEPREQTVYVMTRVRPDAPLGPGLRPQHDCAGVNTCSPAGGGSPAAGKFAVRSATLDQLAQGMLTAFVGAVVLNESNTSGVFDVELSWRPDVAGVTVDPNDARPGLLTAVQEQLGLKLTPERRPVDVLVIESIERPTPD